MDKPSRYVTRHPGQLSLAIPNGRAEKCTVRCTSLVGRGDLGSKPPVCSDANYCQIALALVVAKRLAVF